MAKVDAQQHKSLAKRFEVKGFPTIKFFNGGKMYDYKGKRTVDDFVSFVNGGYKGSSVKSSTVPGQGSLTDVIMDEIEVTKKDFQSLLGTKKNVLLVAFSSGMILGMLLCFCCCNKKAAKVKQN